MTHTQTENAIQVDRFSVKQSDLTAECWPVQIQGLAACARCEYRDKPDCGGKTARKQLAAGTRQPVGKHEGRSTHRNMEEALQHTHDKPQTFRTYSGAWRTVGGELRRTLAEIRRMVARDLPPGWTATRIYLDNGDGYSYSFGVKQDGDTENAHAIDVTYKLADSVDYEGEGDPWQGVNVSLSVVRFSGLILIDYTPHNYTPEVWTRDAGELIGRVLTSDLDRAQVAAEIVKAANTQADE